MYSRKLAVAKIVDVLAISGSGKLPLHNPEANRSIMQWFMPDKTLALLSGVNNYKR